MTTEESVTITQTEPDGTVTTIEVTQTKPEDIGEGGESIIEEIVEALFDVSDDAPVDPAADPTGDEIFTADQFEATAPVDLETEPVTTDPADFQSSEVFVPVDYSVSTEQVPFTTETPDVSLISDTETASTVDAVDPNLQIAQEAQEAANEFAARGDYEAAADAREVAENAAWEAGDQSVLEGSSSTELDSAAHSQDLADYHRDLQEEYTAQGDYQAAQAEADKVVDHTVNADYLGSGDDHSTAGLKLVGSDFALERALMVGELYRKDGIWRFAAVGQGFNVGLDALVKHFGGEVAEESAPVVVQEAAKPKFSLEKKVAEKAPGLVNLAKKAQVCLEKKKLDNVKGRVAIVLDASGSMSNQYRTGKVQEVIERILPLAVHFDDDGSLDCWAFADREKRLESVTLSNYKNYVRDIAKIKQYGGDIGIGCSNNEPRAIKDVMDFFIKENPSKLPTYIVFITDGGVNSDSQIKKLIVDAAKYPIFWQFVGIGGSSYGILKKLDDMSGRVVDNCNFFELDNLSSVSEDKLYDLLLEEFPSWIKEATKKGII